jgi:hypothetical protein
MINRIILTSRTKVVGVAGLLETYFIQQGHELIKFEKDGNNIQKGDFKIGERTIQVWVSYSPSERNEYATLDDLIRMYGVCLRDLA